MSILPHGSIPVNPIGDGLVAMDRAMIRLGYNCRCRSNTKIVVRKTGCVADAVPEFLAAFDLAVVEGAFVEALPAVPWDDEEAWGDAGIYLDLESLLNGSRSVPRMAVLIPPELDEVDDEGYPWGGD